MSAVVEEGWCTTYFYSRAFSLLLKAPNRHTMNSVVTDERRLAAHFPLISLGPRQDRQMYSKRNFRFASSFNRFWKTPFSNRLTMAELSIASWIMKTPLSPNTSCERTFNLYEHAYRHQADVTRQEITWNYIAVCFELPTTCALKSERGLSINVLYSCLGSACNCKMERDLAMS